MSGKFHFLQVMVLLLLMTSLPAPAQTLQDSVRVYFKQGKADFDPFYEGNGRHISEFIDGFRRLQRDSTLTVRQVHIFASASPEGSVRKNEQLAYDRANAIADYLTDRIRFDRSALTVDYTPVDWALLERRVRESGRSVPYRDEVLEAIRWKDLNALRTLRRGKAWAWLYGNVFPDLRQTFVIFSVESNLPTLPDTLDVDESLFEMPLAEWKPLDTWMPYVPLKQYKRGRSMYLKTNLLTWILLEANLAVEFELSDHISFNLPVYYTALDWFQVRTKFRVLGTQPELRWWPRRNFEGPFIGAHGSFGWYNVTWKTSRYRFQDRATKTPAYGGGLDVGYRVRLDPRGRDRWGLEFSVGAGYLYLDYDMFWNEPNGAWVDSRVRHYWGIDHATVSLTWRIPVAKSKLL